MTLKKRNKKARFQGFKVSALKKTGMPGRLSHIGTLETLKPGGVASPHACGAQLGKLDCGILGEPSASAEPAFAHFWHSPDHDFPAPDADGNSVASLALDRIGIICCGMAIAVRGPRHRAQATGVF